MLDATMVDKAGFPVDLVVLEPTLLEQRTSPSVENSAEKALEVAGDTPAASAVDDSASSAGTPQTSAAEAEKAAAPSNDDTFIGLHRRLQQAEDVGQLMALGDHIKVSGVLPS